ncbi:MAG: hypothetical protein ACFFAO_12465 [Candidatus Hermodarchaeota archaeon]
MTKYKSKCDVCGWVVTSSFKMVICHSCGELIRNHQKIKDDN